MSYDLLVFDPAAAPRKRAAFLDWFRAFTNWDAGYDYNNIDAAAPCLKAWFLDMIKEFPPMNGPYALDAVEDGSRVSGYGVGPSAIYVDFRWSEAEYPANRTLNLAIRHSVGVFMASDNNGAVLYGPGDVEDFMGL